MPRAADHIKDVSGSVAEPSASSEAAAPAADSLTEFASAQGNQAMVARMEAPPATEAEGEAEPAPTPEGPQDAAPEEKEEEATPAAS